MAMADVQATKHKLVTKILENPTYTPKSAVWCRLYNRLMSLSQDDLANLDLLIGQKGLRPDTCPDCGEPLSNGGFCHR